MYISFVRGGVDMNCCDRFPKKSFVLLLSLVLCGLILAQGLRIENANVRGRGGREITFYRPHAPEDAWWYSSDVECVHDVGCVDVVFCMDTSGSMAGTINNLQDEIDRFAYNIASVGFGYAFGLVTYSETVNFPHGSTLVEDLGAFSAILDEARSGDGGWEHHSDAIYQAIMNFNWRPGCEHVVVLISDECDDASTVTPSATIAQILSWGGFVYILSADCGDVDDFRDYCDTSNGKWFNYSTSTLNDVFDQIVDDIADVVEINITVTNTSGGAMNPITATLIPDFCIMVGDSPNPQPYGPVPNGASHTFVWDVEEIPGCAGWGDCFIIRVAGGAYVDSIVGCLWVEDCGCPGPEAVFVCPEGSGNWTACRDQYIEIEYVGYIGVDPNSLCIRVNGVNHCYPASPNLTWTPGFRGGTLRFTPTPPGWNHLQTVNVQCLSGNDATGCPQRFFPESNFRVDIKPPRPIWWEHHDATWWPPSPAWREAHDGSVSWQPACGSTVDDTTHIIIYALLHDDGVGMTPLDAILSSLDFSELAGLDFIGLWTSLTSINVTVNGIPFVPGFPIPGHFSRTVDLDYATYLLHPASWFGGWAVACTIRADSAGILGLAFLTGGEIEICLNANDLVEASGCMPCDNDTQWCCTYYLSADLPLVANAGPDKYICSGSSVIIGGTPAAGGGTEPYNYSWSPSTGLSNPNIANPIASPTTTTTYTLTVTDAASGVATDNMTVYVSNPVANAGPDDTLCAGSYVMLGGSPTGSGGFPPLSYSWQPAGLLASPTSANPMFITSMSWGDTSFTFIVTVTDTLGCTDVDTVRIVIDNVDADAGPDQRVCLGGSVTLGGSPTASGGVPPYTYHWYEYPGGAMISTDPNPVVTPSATTTYVVQINGGEPYCMAADTCIVYVVEVFADAGPDQSVCLGSSVTIGGSPTASGSGGYSYSWISVPAGFVSAVSNPMVSPTGNTRYIVTVTDSIGCTDIDTVFVEVFPAPFGWVSVPSFCGGVTSCAYQSIIWTIVDTVGTINEASIRISVDGTVYTVASPEVTTTAHIGDSLSIMFSPGSSWPHGDTIVFELINVASFAGCSTFVAPCSFIVDIEPPIADPLLPADGSTVFVVPDSVGAFISDFPAGVDPLSFNYITITVNGLPATGWTYTWTGGYLGFNNLVLSEGDSVVICLDSLFDDPDYDYCAHNDTSLCWWFVIMPCDVEVTASPDTIICGSGDIVLNADVEGGSGFFTYEWRPAVGLDDPTLANPTAIVESTITYVVEVYDESLMCSAYDTATIIVSNPIANAGPDGIICPFSIVPLGCNPAVTGGLPPYSFEWMNSTGAVIYTVENPLHSFGDTDEWFVLHVVDSLGCEAWDTVFFDVDVEEITSFDFISPLPDDTLPAGEVYFEWEVEPSGGYLYDFILDGAVVFSRIDSNHVTLDFPCGESHFWTVVVWRECFHDYVACGETTSTVFIDSLAYPFDPPFHMEDCGEPYAVAVHVPDGDWTACNPDSIVAYIIDSVGIIESSIMMTVNGTSYRTSDPELSWDGVSTLVFRPSVIWADGEIVTVCVDSAVNLDSIELVARVCWEFYIDRSAPQIVSISPTPFSEIPTTVSTVRVCVRDMLSGLDSLIIDVDGVLYELGAFGCVDTVVCNNFPIGPLSPGDVVDVNLIRATDCPDWCGPNVLDSVWDYLVSDCDIEITFDLGIAETLICHPDSLPVVFELTTTVTGGTAPFTYWNSMEGIVGPTHVGDPTYNLDHSTLISIVVEDAAGCRDTASMVVYISDLQAYAGPDFSICEGDTATIGCPDWWWIGFHVGTVTGWWTNEDGSFLSDETTPLVWPDVTTSYILHVVDSVGCEDTDTITVFRHHEAPGAFTGLYPPPDAMLPPGDITIIWSDAGGVPPAQYHLIIDGVDTVARGISDTFFTVNYPCGHTHSWEVIAYNICASEYVVFCDSFMAAGAHDSGSVWYHLPDTFGGIDTSAYDPIFHTHPCEGPSAVYSHVPTGDWTACNPDSVVWILGDSVTYIESTIEVVVNGVSYTTIDPELSWDGSEYLIFRPSPMWPSGTTVRACLATVMSEDSLWLPDSVCGEFYVDFDPPEIWGIDPAPGSVIAASVFSYLDFMLFDFLSGLDDGSITIDIGTHSFGLFDPVVTWDADSVISIDLSSFDFECGDTIDICVYAEDSPDWCGPNVLDTCWTLITSPCGLNAIIIEPLPNTISACEDQEIVMEIYLTDTLCPVDPSTIVLQVEGVDYTIADPELDWSDPILTWTPPVDWIHGTSVEVCLTAAEDSCGGEAEGLPICWEFEIDLEPPVVVGWNPPCSSAVNPSSGVDFNISLEDGPANIGSVWISINGTDFDLGSALTISGSNADFVWNPVVDGGITLIPGSSFEFCVHASDTNIHYCENHDTVYCCEYFVTSDTGVVTGIIIEPLPNTITTCDDQAIVMEIMGSETTFRTKNLLWLTDNGYSSGRLSDASLTGYSNAAESLSVWGWNVDEISQTIVLTSALVEGYDVIVIGNVKTDGPRAYTSAERTVLTDFVASGGKVLAISGWVVADHDINLENFLLADIGVSFTPYEMWTSYVSPEPGSPIEGGVTQVPGNGCKWIIGLDECWAYRGSDCAVGVKHHGAGAVVGYFDEHWLFNGPWHSMDFTTHQNTRLFRNIMEYIESSFDSTDCPIDPSSIILRVEGTDYTVADAELDWTPSQLTFTPSVLWTHGQVVDVCLVQAEDSCGAVLEDSICWQFTVDLEPPALASIVPACGSPIIPLINDHWDITLIDIPAGVMPDSTFVILGDDTCNISDGGGTFSFTFDPDDYGIILIPGDTITLCIRSMDGPVDYCEPNDTIYCCDYPIFPSEGPIAYPVRVPPDSISACEPESIIIEITSEFEVVESTIVLNVDGIDYRTFNPELTWLDPFLTYLPNPDWNPHDTVFVQLVSARDIFENQYVNYPLEWVFYIDRVEPQSAMIEPPEFTRDIWHQIVITLSDQLAGVNPNSLILEVEGIEYHYPGDFDWNSSGLGGSIVWNPVQHGVEYNAGDTIDVRIYAEDDPDLCLPNVHTAEYSFIVEPWTPCMVNPNPFSPNGDNINEITTFDWPNMTTEAAVIYIFDIRNILVRKLDIEPQRNYLNYPARAWDGYDSEGQQMPQGLYLYVIESDGRIVCNGTITLVR